MVSSRPVRYSKSRLPLHTDPWDRILGSRHAVHAAHGTTQTERQRRGDRTDMEHRQAEAATDKARMKSRLRGQASAADLQDVVLHGRHVAHAHPVLGCGAHHALQWEGHAWMGAPVEGTIWRLDGWGSVSHTQCWAVERTMPCRKGGAPKDVWHSIRVQTAKSTKTKHQWSVSKRARTSSPLGPHGCSGEVACSTATTPSQSPHLQALLRLRRHRVAAQIGVDGGQRDQQI